MTDFRRSIEVVTGMRRFGDKSPEELDAYMDFRVGWRVDELETFAASLESTGSRYLALDADGAPAVQPPSVPAPVGEREREQESDAVHAGSATTPHHRALRAWVAMQRS